MTEILKKIAFIFPGQGAQYPGMGKDFYENFSVVRETFEEADDLLQQNFSKVILNGPQDLLKETRNSQVGIFVLSVAILRVLKDSFSKIQPDVCAGLSLGEYSALVASSKISFNDCLRLVERRGYFMSMACERVLGTMAVVLGLDSSVVEELSGEVKGLWAANFNCPGQVVISGTLEGVERGKELALKRGAKKVLPLKVHGAFHSGLMQEAKLQLEPFIQNALFLKSPIEIVMNVPGDFVHDQRVMIESLIAQVTQPVRWEQGIRQMVLSGVDRFYEIGCGRTLSGFNKRIGIMAKTVNIETIKDLEEIAKCQKSLS